MNARTPTLALALLAAMTLAACDHETTQQAKRDAVIASQKVERAIEKTGEKIADASRKATAEVKEAGRDMKDGVQDAKTDARTTETGRAVSDTAITAAIKGNYLLDPDLSVLKIEVDTKDGVVVLNGLTPSAEAKARAEKLAAANKGVREVRNHLSVKQG